MFNFLNTINASSSCTLQIISKQRGLKDEDLQNFLQKQNLLTHSVKSTCKQSVLASKYPQSVDQKIQPAQYQKEPNHQLEYQKDKDEQNDLTKIKRYSKILDSQIQFSKRSPQKRTNLFEMQNLVLMASDQQSLSEKNLTDELQKLYNHYALTNQRKTRVLAKAKQLGKSHFYKFLKDSSIIGKNQHMHRLFLKSHLQNKQNLSFVRSKQVSPDEPQPLVISFEPVETHSVERKKKKLGLPPLIQKQNIKSAVKQKVSLKTQPTLDPNFCLTKEGSSLELKMNQSKKQHLVRCLTEINQKLRKNRKVHHQKDNLLFPTQNLSMRNQQTFLSKWKYKSFFESAQDSIAKKTVRDENKTSIKKVKTLVHCVKKRFENNQSPIGLRQDQNLKTKLKFLKISRSKILKKQETYCKILRNFSLIKKQQNS